MTKKLYYIDAYIKEFKANVVSVEKCEIGFDVVLDETAFFPEEGGQSSDTGFISEAEVLSVYESEGVVHHITDIHPGIGEAFCRINFDERFEKMQIHTAEHIVCGIIHRLYGFENVGFHLGADEVTFDISSPLTREELDRVENLANEAVFSNIGVEAFFPTKEELASIKYRSKLELTDGVRIVRIGDVDSCACCAPHVSKTGEIGIIKLLDFMRHRGGIRIWISAGRRALLDYRKKYENIKKISAQLSTPQHNTAAALDAFIEECKQLKFELKNAHGRLAVAMADSVSPTEKNSVHVFDGFSMEDLRAFANAAKSRVGGMLVALSGSDGDYKYIIASNSVDLSAEIKKIKTALTANGGGKSGMIQGTFNEPLEKIKGYFISN